MAASGKKRKCLTFEERLKVLEQSKCKSARQIALDFNIGKTQVQNILKRKTEIVSEMASNVNMDRKRVRRPTGNEEVNDLVWTWFQDMTSRKLPLSGPLIKTRALKFAEELGNTNFKASNGWLESFLRRHNIVFSSMNGERGDVDLQTVNEWTQKLPTLCEGYSPSNIFNLDETGLFFRDTSKKSFHVKGKPYCNVFMSNVILYRKLHLKLQIIMFVYTPHITVTSLTKGCSL